MIRLEKNNGIFNAKGVLLALSLLPNGVYTIAIKKHRKPRSNDQNGYLWGCVYPLLLKGMINTGWEFVSVEQIHEFFKAQFTFDKVINRNTGEIVELPASTRDMDTVSFMTYIDKLREYALEFLGIDIPEPDKNWKQHEIST